MKIMTTLIAHLGQGIAALLLSGLPASLATRGRRAEFREMMRKAR
jgi:hypothetical protein